MFKLEQFKLKRCLPKLFIYIVFVYLAYKVRTQCLLFDISFESKFVAVLPVEEAALPKWDGIRYAYINKRQAISLINKFDDPG